MKTETAIPNPAISTIVQRTSSNYLRTEDEEFITDVAQKYGTNGAKQAEAILEQTAALFAGGALSEDDQLAFLHEIQGLYLESKEKAKRFTPKKFLTFD